MSSADWSKHGDHDKTRIAKTANNHIIYQCECGVTLSDEPNIENIFRD
jgi:hypothetical protein